MDPPFRVSATPSTPLFPISPDRANKQPVNHAIPNSPSAPTLSFHSRSRNNSDVQGKVEKFNSLTKEASERRRANEAALKRAVVGREEAENETRRTKDELKNLKIELNEGKDRERKVGERLESVLEELHRVKETHKHSITLYEKEVRRARKEAFKYSSALVKLQEDLKATRISLRNAHNEIEGSRNKTEKREQEAFAARYKLIGVQEELAKTKERVEVVEQERDALKTSLKEEEVARIAAEGRISLPSPTEDEMGESSPQKEIRPLTPVVPVLGDDTYELAAVKEELGSAKTRAIKAEEMVDFMRMECQFRCCSCRVAEWHDTGYVHDDTLANAIEHIRQERYETLSSLGSDKPSPEDISRIPEPQNHLSGEPTQEQSQLLQQQPISGTHDIDDLVPTTHAPGNTLTAENFRSGENLRPNEDREPHPVPLSRLEKSHSDPTTTNLDHEGSLLSLLNAPHSQPTFQPLHPEAHTDAILTSPEGSSTPNAITTGTILTHPHTAEILATSPITTTTTIPIQDTATSATPPVLSPATMSREEALEQIRRRRGRTKSIAAVGTPKSNMPRRDISAPAK
ncbi:hypothetical protein FGG08_004004 [Glutinoglossum americanum]|uniref:Uncharacterized protein n=1 Tax=Glutinoglossum americanum TaxID=1670608 RepID=A0A9P8I5Z7_9PEZI|nr:hypothetical protein FGG08_004004 [Glutinoglossum americanum]